MRNKYLDLLIKVVELLNAVMIYVVFAIAAYNAVLHNTDVAILGVLTILVMQYIDNKDSRR